MTSPEVRLLALWAKATPGQRRAGREWYPREADELLSLARTDSHRVLGVASALSPRVPWEYAKRLAVDAWHTGLARGHIGAACASAQRMLEGETPLDVLSGPKVRAFYLALRGDRSAAVVDVHMWRACGLEPGLARYPRAAEAVSRAARRVREHTSEFQATVWLVQREGISV